MLIQSIHADFREIYGSPRMFRELRDRGFPASKPRVERLMHHSDCGSQYASHSFQGKLKEYGMICSMSRKGNCWDNAPTESWLNSFKNERVYGLRFETRAEMTAMSFAYIEVLYNRKR